MGLVADICPKSTRSQRKTTEMLAGKREIGSLQRDFTVADIRDFTRDPSRTSKCFHIWHRYEVMAVRGKGGGRGRGCGSPGPGSPKGPREWGGPRLQRSTCRLTFNPVKPLKGYSLARYSGWDLIFRFLVDVMDEKGIGTINTWVTWKKVIKSL